MTGAVTEVHPEISCCAYSVTNRGFVLIAVSYSCKAIAGHHIAVLRNCAVLTYYISYLVLHSFRIANGYIRSQSVHCFTICQIEYLTQLRIAETEKYAHVTFFFNGGVEKPNDGEDRELIPSSKVATFDMKPEMSAYEVTEKAVELINEKKYDVMILNFANCDMVGHTGVFDAAKAAVEAVDTCVGKTVAATLDMGGVALITADHGNADKMYEPDGSPFTAHTTFPVPFCVVGKDCTLRKGGRLADIAPTMLEILGLPQPAEMTGNSLIG